MNSSTKETNSSPEKPHSSTVKKNSTQEETNSTTVESSSDMETFGSAQEETDSTMEDSSIAKAKPSSATEDSEPAKEKIGSERARSPLRPEPPPPEARAIDGIRKVTPLWESYAANFIQPIALNTHTKRKATAVAGMVSAQAQRAR